MRAMPKTLLSENGSNFCRDVNNVLIAFTARRYGFKAEPFLIGQGELVRQLASSAARDFGIGTEFEAVHTLATISESNDPVWKERKLDRLKWDWLEEHSFSFRSRLNACLPLYNNCTW